MTFLEWLQYLLLGIVQGLSEILPISSSGHLALFQFLFQLPAQGMLTFSILLHVGSLLAVVVYFFPLLSRLCLATITWFMHGITLQALSKNVQEDMQLILWLAVATIPAAWVGVGLKSFIEVVFSELWMVGLGFIISALVVAWLGMIKQSTSTKIGLKQSLYAGIFQVLGILPGISRSGSTLLGARLSGLSLSKAKEFAFLMFLPITLGAFVVDLLSWDATIFNLNFDVILAMMMATCLSSIATYGALHLFLHRLKPSHFQYFSFYLIGLGLITLLFAALL
jgi:undecaprenyl-diphosphatase